MQSKCNPNIFTTFLTVISRWIQSFTYSYFLRRNEEWKLLRNQTLKSDMFALGSRPFTYWIHFTFVDILWVLCGNGTCGPQCDLTLSGKFTCDNFLGFQFWCTFWWFRYFINQCNSFACLLTFTHFQWDGFRWEIWGEMKMWFAN